MHAATHASTRRPFDRPQERFSRDDGLRRARPFARPSGLNWLHVAMRAGEVEMDDERDTDAAGPFALPARGRR
jgi:hypothetical protein